MRLVVLCDNNTFIDNYLLGEPAVSFYIENGEDKVLFDLGYSDVYIRNAQKLGLELANVKKIVFSHGHDDHTKGIEYFNFNSKPEIYYCGSCFQQKRSGNVDISCPYTEKEMNKIGKTTKIEAVTRISPNLYVLGNIPRKYKTDTIGLEVFEDGKWVVDEFSDDTAMVYDGVDGLVIITGCSHSGICNIVEYASEHFHKKINCVIGGFHLLELNQFACDSIKALKKFKIRTLYPSHCTSLHVKAEMIAQGMNVKECGSGLELNIE